MISIIILLVCLFREGMRMGSEESFKMRKFIICIVDLITSGGLEKGRAQNDSSSKILTVNPPGKSYLGRYMFTSIWGGQYWNRS